MKFGLYNELDVKYLQSDPSDYGSMISFIIKLINFTKQQIN